MVDNNIPQRKFGGFDPKIFLENINPDFICTICSCVVRSPNECSGCGTLYYIILFKLFKTMGRTK